MRKIVPIVTTWLFLLCTACSHPDQGARGAATGGKLTPQIQVATHTKPFSFSILQDYPKGEDLREVEQDFQLMKELGITTWRGSFPWGDYEPERGVYDFSWLHRFMEIAGRNGFKLRPYLGYTPAWAAKGGKDSEHWNDPPKRVEDWSDFVATIVREMKKHNSILSWEIYNEENVAQWWDGTPAEYNEVLRHGAAAVRVVSPGTPVVFGGMVYPDDDWMKEACVTHGNARKFDILPIHAYPETWTAPTITVENYLDQGMPGSFKMNFLAAVDEMCGKKPIWINETGFATTEGKSEADQANWWARAFATFLAEPRVEHLGIYQIKERPVGTTVIGGSENYHLGITKPDRKKKMAFHMVKRLVSLLNTGTITVADGELKAEVTSGKAVQLYRHLFIRPDGRQVLFVWDKGGSPTLKLTTARKGSEVVEYGLDGKPEPFRDFDGRSLEKVALKQGRVRIFEIRP